MKAYTQNKIAISTRLASLKKRALSILMRCLAASTIVYAPIGMSAPLADDSWELAAIGKNRTDEKVSVNSLGSAIASNFPLTYVQFTSMSATSDLPSAELISVLLGLEGASIVSHKAYL